MSSSFSGPAPAGIGAEETGRLGFVFIPRVADRQSQHHMFWPALIFPSPGELRRRLPSPRDMQMFDMEWENHQMNQRGALGEQETSRHVDGAMKVAFLLGSEMPPSGTRSFPVYSQDVTVTSVQNGEPLSMKPHTSFAKKNREYIRNMELYSNHDRFLQALVIAERYRANRDMSLLISSMNWPPLPNAQWHHVQQPPHHLPSHHLGASSAPRTNVPTNSYLYVPSASDSNIAASRADSTSTGTGMQWGHLYGTASKSQDDANDDGASDDEFVVNVDSSGVYNIPTPSRDGLLSQTSKSALRKVAVEGPSAASTGRNGRIISGGCNSQIDAYSNDGQEMEGNEDMEDAQSPQRPKQIDFDAAAAVTSARDTGSDLPIGSSTTTSELRACSSSGETKHVRFDAATSSASTTRGECNYGAGSGPTSTAAPTANVTPSHGPSVVDETEAPSSSSAVKTSRHATPSPTQGDCDTTSNAEKKTRSTAPAISTDERYKRLRALIKPDMDWSIVIPTLKDHGWATKPGRGLVSYYYCCSKFAHESVSYMVNHAKRGDEYFCSDEELKTFCREKLGWVGSGSDSDRRRERTGSNASTGNPEAKMKSESGRPKRESTRKPVVAPDVSSSAPSATRKKLSNPAKNKETRMARVKASPDKVNSSESTSDHSDSSDSHFGRVPLTSSAMRERSAVFKVESSTDRGKSRSNSGGAALKSKTAATTKTKTKTKSKQQTLAKEKTKQLAKSGAGKGQKPATKKKEKEKKVARPLMADPSPTPPSSSPAESTGSSPDSDAGPETIMTDQIAFSGILLPVFKFRYSKGFYCLPGIDPKSPEVLEGKDYFKRITSLRRHLCAYGIPLTALVSSKGKTGRSSGGAARRSSRRDTTNHVDIDSLMHKDDRRALARWVRYAVSRSLVLKTEVPADIDRFPPKSFMNGPWQLLQKLGYKFSSGSYKVPTAEGSSISFDRAEDLEVHLARFGLVEDTSALKAEELLKLELYIAGCSNVNLFQRIGLEDDLFQNQGLQSSAPSLDGSNGDMSAKGIEEDGRDIGTAPSPSSLKTVKASGVEEGQDDTEQHSSTPMVPQLLVFNQLPPSTSSSALSENSFNPDCPNGIPEVGDDEGRNAVRALSLEGETGNDGLGQEDMVEDEMEDENDAIAMNQADDAEDGEELHLQGEKAASDPSLGRNGQDEEKSLSRKRGISADTCTSRPDTSGTDRSSKKLRKSSSPDRASFGASSDRELSHLSDSDDGTVIEPLPDRQATVLDKLRCCQSVLHSDHVDDMYRKSSRVENHANRITKFLNEAMSAHCKAEDCSTFEASSMYVCGGPGTGKTTTLNKCINKCKGKFSNARFIFRNAASCGHDGPSSATRILNDIKEEMQVAGSAGEDAIYAKIEKRLLSQRTSPLVLVLDEIDMLLSYSNRSTDNLSGGDLLIKSFLDWASNPNLSFVLIGISNAVDNGYTERLQSLGKISHTLVFKPYREEDLISIIEARVGTKIIAEPAIKMVSRKVAAGSGDARKALDMTAQAVRKCETDLSVEQQRKSGDDVVYPIVKLPHMMRSIREGMGMRHTDAIMSMPQAAKIVLCVAVALSTVSPAWKIIRMKDLKKYCAEASRHGLMERLNIDHLFDIVQMLSDSGLLLSGDGNNLRYSAYQMDVHEIPLMLGVQLDDVECALEKTLMNEPFYKNMVSYVKKHHR